MCAKNIDLPSARAADGERDQGKRSAAPGSQEPANASWDSNNARSMKTTGGSVVSHWGTDMGRSTSSAFRGAFMTAILAMLTSLFMLASTPTAGAATVLTISPLPHRMPPALQGSMCASPNVCNKVKYSWALNVAIERLTEAIAEYTSRVAPPGASSALPDGDKVTVFALSGGAAGASTWMARNAASADAPSPEVLSFVLIGNPTRKYGGAHRKFHTMPQTQYQVIDIARQYDPIADTPNRFSLLAQMNLALGFLSPLHVDYSTVDIDDPANYRWTEGNTTYILVPTEDLPLLSPLRALGLKALADRLNGPLKEIIERAYDRPWELGLTEQLRTVAQPRSTETDRARTDEPSASSAASRSTGPGSATAPKVTPPAQAVDDPAAQSVEAESARDEAELRKRATGKSQPAAPADSEIGADVDSEAAEVVSRAAAEERRQQDTPAVRRADKVERDTTRATAREKKSTSRERTRAAAGGSRSAD